MADRLRRTMRCLPELALGTLAILAACSSGTGPNCSVSNVSVGPNPVSLTINQSATVTAGITSANCSTAPTISWSSANAAVSVQPLGFSAIVTGVSATASPVAITATAMGVSGSTQVSVGAQPAIHLSSTTLNFFATQGAPNPGSQFTSITNTGGGTLSNLSVGTITYGPGATTWLQTPQFSSTTAPSNLTIQPLSSTLPTGSFSATVPVRSTVANNTPQNLTINLTVSPADGLVALVGNNQTGLVGFPLNINPAVRLTSGGTPVVGNAVTFAVQTGGGSVIGLATISTNANGVAQMQGWQLGAVSGSNTITATATGAGVIGNPVTFTANGANPTFNITIQNVGPPFSAPVQAAFNAAVAKWQQIIYQDIPDVNNFSSMAGQCGTNSPALGPQTVDDVIIFARIDSIDGPNGILGSAGPCFIRISSGLTILGQMTFDSADMEQLSTAGYLNSVILHEMGHVLGFGTLWGQSPINCLANASNPPGTILDTYYNCPKGQSMFDSIGGTTYTGGNKVPVENCGPASPPGCTFGTVNSHWREPTFNNELMTGYLNSGSNPLSKLSAAAMEDIGYVVNYAGADPYVHVFTLRSGTPGASPFSLGNDIYRGPIYVTDPGGRIVKVLRPK